MKKHIRFTAALLSAAAVLGVFAGCSTKAATTAAGTANTGTSSGVQEIVVGTGHAYSPYCYLDANGNLAGYEYEVLKAVNELLPQYKFTFQTFDFKNVLLALDSGKIAIGAHQFEKNPQREANYLFGKESYTTYVRYIIVRKDNPKNIKTLDDLAGKNVQADNGDNATHLFQEYNKTHTSNPIKLDLLDSPPKDEVVAGIKNGRWDAFSTTKRDLEVYNKQYGDGLRAVGSPILTSDTYFVFKKGNTKLQEAVDGTLKKLKTSGKLAAISKKVIGADYTKNE